MRSLGIVTADQESLASFSPVRTSSPLCVCCFHPLYVEEGCQHILLPSYQPRYSIRDPLDIHRLGKIWSGESGYGDTPNIETPSSIRLVLPECPTSPTMDDESMPMLPISIDVQAPSPTNSDVSDDRRSGIAGALSLYKNRLMGNFGVSNERGRSRSSRRSGYLFFLPARLIPGAVPVPDFGSRRPSPSRTSNTRSNSRGSRVCIDDELESNSQATYASASSLHPVTESSSQQVFSRPPSPGVQTQDERLMEPPPYVDEEIEVGHSSRRSKTSEGWYLW